MFFLNISFLLFSARKEEDGDLFLTQRRGVDSSPARGPLRLAVHNAGDESATWDIRVTRLRSVISATTRLGRAPTIFPVAWQ